MGIARDTLIEILKENGGSMDVIELSKKLHSRTQLGFGVETMDVVQALVKRKKVLFDEENEIVSLITQE